MIGHYINIQNTVTEARILTSVMVPGKLIQRDGSRCLLGVVEDRTQAEAEEFAAVGWYEGHAAAYQLLKAKRPRLIGWGDDSVGLQYDALCTRFTAERINAAIRNRILSNQARRVLKPSEAVVVYEGVLA